MNERFEPARIATRRARDPDTVQSGGAKTAPELGRVDERLQRAHQGGAIAGRHEKTGRAVLHDLGNGVDGGGDRGQACGRGFLKHHAERLVPGWHHEDIHDPGDMERVECELQVTDNVLEFRWRMVADSGFSDDPVIAVADYRRPARSEKDVLTPWWIETYSKKNTH